MNSNEKFYDTVSQLGEINRTIDTLWKENKDKGMTHINLNYDDDTEILNIICGFNKNPSDSFLGGKFKIDTYTLCALLTGVINDPQFICSNTKEVANVYVDFGAFR